MAHKLRHFVTPTERRARATKRFARAGVVAAADALLDHFKECRSDEWPASADHGHLWAWLAEQHREELRLLGEPWTWQDTLANALDNHQIGRDSCEACDA